MEVGLVGVTTVGRYQGGAVTCREKVGGVVETHELRSTLGSNADLRPEPRPQALAAPSGLGCQPVNPNPPPAGHHLLPREGDFRVDPPAGVMPPSQRGLRDREPVLPRPCGAQLLLGSLGVAPPPEVIEGDDRPANFGAGTKNRVRDERREPHLEALEAPAAPPADAPGRQSGDNPLSPLLLTTAVVDDDRRVTDVEDHHDSRVGDHPDIDDVISSIAEPRHSDTCQPQPPP